MTAPEAPFEQPWQAQLFAMTVALNEAGAFTWSDWAAAFGPRVQEVESDAYWDVWSEALVAILDQRGIATSTDVERLTRRWQEAAHATPHGQPIELSAAPQD
ncbi:nitrile hydratase accessory protein [Roseobacter sp. HKCCA0434]|uniref:nitrile hydratase accessory protein n=1 Tax=Roseobacter sp. HKCCA0434 TaxID=3079297 RepID=UPI002905CED7|nr:nitrile hydratase accessory protein [Roseobacter sp. HKCCA0434]